MKAEQLVGGPPLRPLPGDASSFIPLQQRLAAAGYEVEGLVTLLGLQSPRDFSAMRRHVVPAYVWRCNRANNPQGWLTKLWMFSQPISMAQAEQAMGADSVAWLQRRGLLKRTEDEVRATVDLYPCEEAWVFTDHALPPPGPPSMEHVYELGADSYALARLTPRRSVERTLDLCTGSGIHAILAAKHSARVEGIDINARAVQFARTNAGIGGVGDRCRFLCGDLYGALADETYDLIVSNPPWVPTPQQGMQLHRTGGESGEIITQRIVEGLSERLRPGGTLAMFVHYPEMRSISYIERLTSWLGGSAGWGIAVVNCTEISLELYISAHQAPSKSAAERELDIYRWMDSYHQLGIERVRVGMVYVRRLSPATPGWHTVKNIYALPAYRMSSALESWLDALEQYNDPAWQPAWDSWQPSLKQGRTVWKEVSTGAARVEFATGGWDAPVALEPDEIQLLDLMKANTLAHELATEWASMRLLTIDSARRETRQLLTSLGRKNVLQ